MRTLVWAALAAVGGSLLPQIAQAQQFPILDQNPPRLTWYEVRTPHFRVLVPAGLESRGQRTAQRLEQLYEPVGASLGVRARPVTIVLQNQTTIGNGFVSMLPRRSEFYATPPQEPFLTGTLDWLDQLAVHEYRHVVQYEKPLQGLSKAAYYLFGYGGLGFTTLGVPDWFFEGDAVGAETVLTRSGRGRIPAFSADLRANLLAGRRFSYPKAVAGSFRDNVPNHYVLGYFLSSYPKRRFGAQVWSEVLNRYYRFPAYPFSFSASLRHHTGQRVETLYARTLAELDSTWRQPTAPPARAAAATEPWRVQPEKRVFTQYQYPQYLNDTTVLVLKSGLGDVPQLVALRPHAPEQRLHTPGLLNLPDYVSAGGGKVCWPEFRFDVRWRQRVFSELRVLDVATGQVRHLTPGGRYTAAALTPDGRQLLAVRTTPDYRNELVVLDAADGRALRVVPGTLGTTQLLQPRWLPDQRTAVVVTLQPAGKALELIDTETGQRRAVLPAGPLNISHPQPWQDYVLYNSPQTGTDQVYAVQATTGRRWQLTHDAIGAYHAAVAPSGRQLAVHVFRATGSRIQQLPLDTAAWTPVSGPAHDPAAYVEPVVAADAGTPTIGSVLPGDSLPGAAVGTIRRYRPAAHLFRVFGWGVVQAPAGSGLSLGVRSQDMLSTLQTVAGASYNQTERAGSVFATASYQGWFPVVDVTVEHGQRRTSGYFDRQTPLDSVGTDRWQYTNFTAGLRVPLVLTRSRFQQGLTVASYLVQEQTSGYDFTRRLRSEVGRNSLHALTASASYYRLLKQSKRDVAPRAGQTLLLSLRTTPFGRGLAGGQWAAQGSVFLPGVGRHHALRLRGGYQWQQVANSYLFSAAVFYPRGLSYVALPRLATSSAEYRLPLADPDWTLGRWLYLQRLKGSLFYDRADGDQFHYQTMGLDVSAVVNVLRLRTPFEIGIRTLYNSAEGQWQVQPLVLDIGF